MRIIAYSYRADVHCVECAKKHCAAGLELLQVDKLVNVRVDEHGLPHNLTDVEGNTIRPVFSTDEQLEPLHCGDCLQPI